MRLGAIGHRFKEIISDRCLTGPTYNWHKVVITKVLNISVVGESGVVCEVISCQIQLLPMNRVKYSGLNR